MKRSLSLRIFSGILASAGILTLLKGIQLILQIFTGEYGFKSETDIWRMVLLFLWYTAIFLILFLMTRNVLRGFIISLKNIRLLKITGALFVLMLIRNLFFDLTDSNLNHLTHQQGVSYVAGNFIGKELGKDFPILIMILLSLLFAAVLSEAKKLEEEQELTV